MISNLIRRGCIIISFIVPLIATANTSAVEAKHNSIQEKLSELEASSGGRIGLYAINTADNLRLQYHAEQRFPFCSTGKVIVVAAILKESEKNADLLAKRIHYTQKDVDESGYAPITKQHINDGMTVAELCKAAMEYSDNTAMNLLIKTLGGVQAVNAYAKLIHDASYRLDRTEPELNTAIPGDVRDTTTPVAMTNSLHQLTLGSALALPQRERLLTWLKNNTTGDLRIRAGVPKGWVVGDKTGTGKYGTSNDIAIIWPPQCPPIIMSIYFTQNKKDATLREDVLASATKLVIDEFARTDSCIKTAAIN